MMAVQKPRIKKTNGKSYPVIVGCGEFKMTINSESGHIKDVIFTVKEQTVRESCMPGNLEGHGKMITFALRAGVSMDKMVATLKDIKCPRQPLSGALSCCDGIARALDEYLKDHK